MTKSALTTTQTLSNLLEKQGLKVNAFEAQPHNQNYQAHILSIHNALGLFRVARKTPTKTGWFTAIWKRDSQGNVTPYCSEDRIDFLFIALDDNDCKGYFLFPKSILLERGIMSKRGQGGKRAMRLYTPHDEISGAQAKKTQSWQSPYFFDDHSKKSGLTAILSTLD